MRVLRRGSRRLDPAAALSSPGAMTKLFGLVCVAALAACGGGGGGNPAQACKDGVAALCERLYACYTPAELAAAGYPTTEGACVTMGETNAGCEGQTVDNACTGNETYHGDKAADLRRSDRRPGVLANHEFRNLNIEHRRTGLRSGLRRRGPDAGRRRPSRRAIIEGWGRPSRGSGRRRSRARSRRTPSRPTRARATADRRPDPGPSRARATGSIGTSSGPRSAAAAWAASSRRATAGSAARSRSRRRCRAGSTCGGGSSARSGSPRGSSTRRSSRSTTPAPPRRATRSTSMRSVSGRPLDKLIADAHDLDERLTLLPPPARRDRRDRARTRPRRRPPRPQAGEHPGRRPRRDGRDRLGPRQGDRARTTTTTRPIGSLAPGDAVDDPGRRRVRHARVHGAGAGARRGARRAQPTCTRSARRSTSCCPGDRRTAAPPRPR